MNKVGFMKKRKKIKENMFSLWFGKSEQKKTSLFENHYLTYTLLLISYFKITILPYIITFETWCIRVKKTCLFLQILQWRKRVILYKKIPSARRCVY